jgi:hypothetical protein
VVEVIQKATLVFYHDLDPAIISMVNALQIIGKKTKGN